MMHIGLDIGTSGVKALLISEDEKIVCSHDAALCVSRPQPGWSEQNPDDWIAACKQAIGRIRETHPDEFAGVASIGLSGQMHGATLLDRNDRPLRPCILWNDGRSERECAELEAKVDVRRLTGNIAMAGFTAPKVAWVRKHEPDVFAKIHKVLLPKDYVRFWLTGEYIADPSDAAGTLWLDVEKRQWSEELLAATELGLEHMPGLVEGTKVSGYLRSELAREWGIDSIPVAGGGGDNAATACGMGVLSPGTGFLSLGTSGVLFAATERFAPNTRDAVHAFCHAVPDRWHQMGVILSAVDSLNWFGRITGRDAPDLVSELPERIARPAKALFLPYLSGERTPYNDPSARGAFIDLAISCSTAELTQSVLEGVAFALADCNDALIHAGSHLEAVYAVGGGARSRQWLDIIAAATGLRLLIPEAGDYGAAFGAARLGRACLKETFDPNDFKAPAIQAEIVPCTELAEQYSASRDRFSALFAAVKAVRPGERL
tara:strand:- start:275141 stop:276607 length:1467 start_codon:yes stop_codon:yes gene_type:complete